MVEIIPKMNTTTNFTKACVGKMAHAFCCLLVDFIYTVLSISVVASMNFLIQICLYGNENRYSLNNDFLLDIGWE